MIDTHCHINDKAFINDPEGYILEAQKTGVSKFLVVGFDRKSSEIAVDIASKFENVYAAIGMHPSDGISSMDEDYDYLYELAKNNKVIAIGEIGLDYYWEKDSAVREKQKANFIRQIDIANKLELPISIHCRDALEDCLEILKKYPATKGGIMHCYAGSFEMANDFIKLGFLLGFGGTTTFKNSVRPKEVISKIPANSYVLETDAPYLTPEPFRGKQNHSKYLYLVRNKIAELRNISADQVDRESTSNFERIFKI